MASTTLEDFGRDIESAVDKAAADSLDELATRLIAILQKNAPDNSGYLQETISALPLTQTPNGWQLDISWAEHGTYIDEGVKGVGGTRKSGDKKGQAWNVKAPNSKFSYKSKMPPTNFSTIGGQSLGQYAEAKGISPFAVAKSIFHQGLAATHWATNTLNGQEFDNLVNELAGEFVNSFTFKIT